MELKNLDDWSDDELKAEIQSLLYAVLAFVEMKQFDSAERCARKIRQIEDEQEKRKA